MAAPSPTVSAACSQERVTGTWSCVGVPVDVVDQAPSPAELTARTWMSYWVPLVRPEMVKRREPPVQALSTTVHWSLPSRRRWSRCGAGRRSWGLPRRCRLGRSRLGESAVSRRDGADGWGQGGVRLGLSVLESGPRPVAFGADRAHLKIVLDIALQLGEDVARIAERPDLLLHGPAGRRPIGRIGTDVAQVERGDGGLAGLGGGGPIYGERAAPQSNSGDFRRARQEP